MSPSTTSSARPVTGTVASQPIPFRKQGTSVGGDAVDSLLVACALLAVCLAVLWVAKKKGWLDRWLAAQGRQSPSAQVGLRVEQVLRLSPKTVLYSVAGEGERYLILESSASSAQWQAAETRND